METKQKAAAGSNGNEITQKLESSKRGSSLAHHQNTRKRANSEQGNITSTERSKQRQIRGKGGGCTNN